ncbi:non-ribosomal peptide synthetase [Endothiovibrio diazotrophicus]
MKSIRAFLADLNRLDIQVWDDDGYLGYSAPDGALTPQRFEELKSRKEEVLAFLRQANGGEGGTTIDPAPRVGHYPLSFAQQRLWFLDQQDGPNATYVIPVVIHLRGALKPEMLERSMREIVRRHDSLRTIFRTVEGEIRQVVRDSSEFHLKLVDLASLPANERPAEVERLTAEEAQRPFRLDDDLMLRSTLLRLGAAEGPQDAPAEEEYVLLVTLHHIVSDGSSIGVFFRELAALYNAAVRGEPSPLAELPIQFIDFTSWQREWLEDQRNTRQLAFWEKQLGGELPTLDIPLDHPRSAHTPFEAGHLLVALPRSLGRSLKELGNRHGVTLYIALLSAFKVLLARLANQRDIVVGSPIAGRNRTELEALIGFFIQVVVLRSDLSGNPTFAELMARVKQVTLDAHANQEAPFEKIVEILQPTRNLNHNPLFQVLFNMLPDLAPDPLDGVTIDDFNATQTPPKFDLTLYVRERADEIELQTVYNRALFTEKRIRTILDQYQHLLEQVAADVSRPIDDYSLVTPRAAAFLPDPRQPLPAPVHPPMAGWISEWAGRTPEQTAVAHGTRQWSYRELVAGAEAIAHTLRANGLAAGEVVAIHGERSFGLVAALLGVLYGGGVVLLLDPRLPRRRRERMQQQAQARQLLRVGEDEEEQQWLAERFPRMVSVPSDAPLPSPTPAAPLPSVPAEAPAYLFFTSGSSGEPKGILGNHRGLSHFLHWQRETFAIEPADRFGQLTALSFDVVLRDILLPLVSGATLVLPTEADEMGGEAILRWLAEQRITRTHSVPSLVQSWLASAPPEVSPAQLRTLFLAGEPLTAQLVRQWRERFPEAGEIVNLYGPTETTLAKSFYRVPQGALPGIQPLGTPLPETQLLVLARISHQPPTADADPPAVTGRAPSGLLNIGSTMPSSPSGPLSASMPSRHKADPWPNPRAPSQRGLGALATEVGEKCGLDHARLCGVGEVGEIAIRTPFRTLGYIDQGDKSGAETFLPNPFGDDPADRIYLTGDSGRYHPDGLLEIVGRLDGQVKIRGVRIELGEIEAALNQLPAIRQSVVVAHDQGRGKQLVAYVLLHDLEAAADGQSGTIASKWRGTLRKQLPDYMIPSRFFELDAIPLTASGKIDRRALPDPASARVIAENPFVLPRTPTETTVAEIWSRILERPRISVHDDFFHLGGHSLMATQVLAKIRETFQIELSIRSIFEHSTVAALVEHIETVRLAREMAPVGQARDGEIEEAW